jgi:hypothetical protein
MVSCSRGRKVPELLGSDSELVWINRCTNVNVETRLRSFFRRGSSHGECIAGRSRNAGIEKVKN